MRLPGDRRHSRAREQSDTDCSAATRRYEWNQDFRSNRPDHRDFDYKANLNILYKVSLRVLIAPRVLMVDFSLTVS